MLYVFLAHAVKIKLTRRQERWFEEGRIIDREIGERVRRGCRDM
jgi:hypothetical protein